jgi:hypothetical protein
MDQMVLESLDTILEFPSFSARIDAAALAFYSAQESLPDTSLLVFTDACIARIETCYRPDISEECLCLFHPFLFF